MSSGTLYLIPVPLGAMAPSAVLPESVCKRAAQLRYFVAENAKSARAFLKNLPILVPLQEIAIHELNEHTPQTALPELLRPLLAGFDLGLISEAGCPAVADPGSELVALAQNHGIRVVPLIGPSSILLALMASGLGGQNFAFHGYLPAKEDARNQKITALEKESRLYRRTQIFIETPYRNHKLFTALTNRCADSTRLCLATDLTLPEESILTRNIGQWKKSTPPKIDRRPTVFLLLA